MTAVFLYMYIHLIMTSVSLEMTHHTRRLSFLSSQFISIVVYIVLHHEYFEQSQYEFSRKIMTHACASAKVVI